MGDARYEHAFGRIQQAADRSAQIARETDDALVQALAHASREREPYLANVLASELMNRVQRKNAIFDHAREGMLSLDAEGRVTYLNQAARAMLGRGADELRALDAGEALRGARAAPAWASLLREAGALSVEQDSFARADGSTFPVAYAMSSVMDGEEVTGAIMVFRDVTEELRVKGQLARERAALDVLSTVATAANQATNTTDAIRAALASLCAFGGWRAAHAWMANDRRGVLVSTGLWHEMEPGCAEPLRAATAGLEISPGMGLPGRALATRKPQVVADVESLAFALRGNGFRQAGLRSGAAFPVLSAGRVLAVLEFFGVEASAPEEATVSVVAQAVDAVGRTLERVRAEQSLRESEERFRVSVEHLFDACGIYTSMRDGAGRIEDFRIDYVNAMACEMSGVPREEQVGQRLTDVFPALRHSDVFGAFADVVDTGRPLVRRELTFAMKPEGKRLRRAVDIRAQRLGDGFTATWRDVMDSVLASPDLSVSSPRIVM